MQTDNKVFGDMYHYCTLVKDGGASPSQIRECCVERKKCRGISCKLQDKWVVAPGINSLVSLSYILLYITVIT